MDKTPHINTPAIGGGYVPYFYDRGLHLLYEIPPAARRKPDIPYARSGYDFTSDLVVGRPYAHRQTVEQIIARGYLAVPPSDPTTALIGDKRDTAWLGLDDMVHQIRARYEVYHRNMEDLDQAVCESHNGLFRQLADHGLKVANQRQMYSVDKRVQQIRELQMEERVNLWRDVSRLKLGLPEIAQQYLAAYRRMQILESGDGS